MYKDDYGIDGFSEHVSSIEEELHRMAKFYKEVECSKKAVSHIEQHLKNRSSDDITDEDDLPDVKALYQDAIDEYRHGRDNEEKYCYIIYI